MKKGHMLQCPSGLPLYFCIFSNILGREAFYDLIIIKDAPLLDQAAGFEQGIFA